MAKRFFTYFKPESLLVCLSLLSYLLCMAVTRQNYLFHFIHLGRALRFSSLVLILLAFVLASGKKFTLKGKISKKNLLAMSGVLILILISRFILLENYPFPSRGDELRDGGYNGLLISEGKIKNIFEYGPYNGFGLEIPFITSFFLKFFKNSVLTYRLPAAIVSSVDIILISFLGFLILNKEVAFWAALVLTFSPFHWYLGRTEVVVALDSLFTTLILIGLYFLKDKRKISYAFLGTTIGFSFCLHAAVKVLAILVLLITIIAVLFGQGLETGIKRKLVKIIFLITFCFVGFGPKLWYSNYQNFFQTTKVGKEVDIIEIKDKGLTAIGKINFDKDFFNTIRERYLKSFSVWFYEPVQTRSPVAAPIFPPVFFLFLVFGLTYSFLFTDKFLLKTMGVLAITVPLTHSAMTDAINHGQRIVVLLPIGAILISLGIYLAMEKFKRRIFKIIFLGSFLLYFFFQGTCLFTKRIASAANDYHLLDYLTMHLIYLLKDNPQLARDPICLLTSAKNLKDLDLAHYKEQRYYFFPDLKIDMISRENISDNEFYLFQKNCGHLEREEIESPSLAQSQVISCPNKNSFACPSNFEGEMKIFY